MRSEIRELFTNNSLESDVIREKAWQLGVDYIGGKWKEIENFQDVKVDRMTGGQSNLLYLISSDGAHCFLLRIHCQPAEQVVVDTVIFTVLAERGLGPKIYGFFPGGRLEEYLPSLTLDEKLVNIPEYAAKIGFVYPKYHSIDVPISKNRRATQVMREWLSDYSRLGGESHNIIPHNIKYPNEIHPTSITVSQLSAELETFEKWATVFEDTVVFCHNDLFPYNILELNDTKEIVFIDFEYSTYNWRGFDLAMFLSENAFDYSDPTPPAVKIDQSFYDNHPTMRLFCSSYIEGLRKLTPDAPVVSLEDLMDECRFFLPYVNLIWAIWSLKNLAGGHENGIDLSVAASDRLLLHFHLKPEAERIFNKRNTISG